MAYRWLQPIDVGPSPGVRGVLRRYAVHAPPDWTARRLAEGADDSRALPVVVVLHGGGNRYTGPGNAASFAGKAPLTFTGRAHTPFGCELFPSSQMEDPLFLAVNGESADGVRMVVLTDLFAGTDDGHRYVRSGHEGEPRTTTRLIWEFFKDPAIFV